MIHFAAKAYFFLFLLIPAAVLWYLFVTKKGHRYVFYSSKQLLRTADNTVKTFLIKILFYVKLMALVFFILAMTRPQLLNEYEEENKKGIDIMITLDISGSMASIDFKPRNRLEVAKEVIADFIKKRSTDRLGLVVFAGTSFTRCPLTVDYDILKYFLEETRIGDLEDGTALGMALASSVNRLQGSKKQSETSKSRTKIIILLTDGVNNRGEIDPRDAAKMIAKDYSNIKVYTIGVGTKGQAPFLVKDAYGNEQYVMMDVQIDEDLLKEIANSSGGLYFRATDRSSLQQIFTEIDRWEKTEISTKRYTTARDYYYIFLIAGLFFLFLAEFAKRSFLRTLP